MENSIVKHRRFYKSYNKNDLQEARRQLHLQEQKLKRSLFQDGLRNLHDSISDGGKNITYNPGTRKYKHKYGIDHKLQLSEWLREKPRNLADWILVPCPVGFRCMVVACNGRTEMYNKAGKLCKTFKSLLPGNVGSKKDFTILDCIYVKNKATYYVLDAITYGNQDLQYCEAQFRFYWLTLKLLESSLDEIQSNNHYKFINLDYVDFINNDSIMRAFGEYPFWPNDSPQLDGYLFYHKDASYTCGTTPLVGWLFAFMVPEVLGYSVHASYMFRMPKNYVNYLHYIVKFDEKMAKLRKQDKRNKTKKSKMDEDISEQQTNCEKFDGEDDNLRTVLEFQRDLELEEIE